MGKKQKSVSTSTLGKFRDEVVGEFKQVGKDTVKQVAQEPKRILESILGKPTTKGEKGDQGIEDVQATAGGSDPQQKKQQLMLKRQQDDQKKKAALLRLHRQQLEEEKRHFQAAQQQERVEEQREEMEEEQKRERKVVQLQRERGRSEQLTRQISGRQGSKELGRGKKH